MVLALIGIVSAIGAPNFSKWKKSREVRVGVEKIFGMMNNVITQTQRGHYSYVQIEANFATTPFQIITKGMKRETFSKRLNQQLWIVAIQLLGIILMLKSLKQTTLIFILNQKVRFVFLKMDHIINLQVC